MQTDPLLYPRTADRNFDRDLVCAMREILTKPLAEIYQSLYNFYASQQRLEIACVLRLILEAKITPDNASLIGWFAINNAIPAPTLYLYMKELLLLKDNYYGEQCCIAFAQEVLLFGYRYLTFLESITMTPGFMFRHPDLYIAIHQSLETSIPIEAYVSRNHFSIPSLPRKISLPANPRIILPPIVKSPNEPPMKQTLEECVQASYLMPEEYRRHYLISFVKNTQIPSMLKDKPKVLLEAVCAYAKHLLSNSIHGKTQSMSWDRYNFHEQLNKIGTWIGLLSVSSGPPPPVYFIDMHQTLKSSIRLGCFLEVVFLLAGFFSRASSIYQLPCPYTVSILEIMAAVVHHPGIRLDIIRNVEAFASLFRTNVHYFYKRQVDIDQSSFEMHAVFQLDQRIQSYFLAPYTRESVVSYDRRHYSDFFNFNPSIDSLPPVFREVVEKADLIRNYYFCGHGSAILIPTSKTPTDKLIDFAMSMALSNNPVLANTASRILYKLLVPPYSLDNNRLRFAFPNHDIFLACFRANCLNAKDVNAIFSDILTTPIIGEIALPMVQKIMPLIHQLSRANPDVSFASLYALSNMNPSQDKCALPRPEQTHIPLLRAFIQYCRAGNEATKQEFLFRFAPGTQQQVTGLVLFIFSAVNEITHDYSAVDCYSTVVPPLSKKVSSDVLITGLLKSFEQLTSTMIVTHQAAIFRVVYETFNMIDSLKPERLISFFISCCPGKIPGFAACWIQLVLHPSVFPVLIDSADPTSISFCIKFCITIIKLAVEIPENFYRPVIRIMTTMCDQFPLFITTYHSLLLEHISIHFMQLRNIILDANPKLDHMSAPPIGITYGETQDMRTLRFKADPFIHDKTQQSAMAALKTIAELIKKIWTTDKTVIWRFVYYCIDQWTQSHDQFTPHSSIIDLFLSLVSVSPAFITALLDHVRFSNTHTRFVMELILAVFGRLPDDLRELIVIELLRRHLCITRPPATLTELFGRLWKERQMEITRYTKLRNDTSDLQNVMSVVKILKQKE